MPSILESGELQLSPEEITTYRVAVDRLRQSSEMVVDLERPITLDEWLLLTIADAALRGDLGPLEQAIGSIEAEIKSRRQRN
jgi:hypothetical protein